MIQDIGFYFKVLSRRFPAMAIVLLLSTGVGVVVAMRLPTVYTTSATLLVEAAQVTADRNNDAADISQQLSVIQQRLMTRANLIQVARDNRVFPNQTGMNPDDVVREMRRMTRVRLTSGRGRPSQLMVGFEHQNARKVAAVVNQYVTIILEVSNELNAGQASAALEFFEQEVEALSRDLDTQKARIVEFETQNANALPDNLTYNLSRQSLLQERLARVERELGSLQSQRETIERIYASTGTVVEEAAPVTPEQLRLRGLRNDLNAALGVYSDTHPRVRLLRSQITTLEEQIMSISAPAQEETSEPDTEISALDISLAELDAREETLKEDTTQVQAELGTLRQAIDQTPANRIALEALSREQESLQSLYNAAAQRLSAARQRERIVLASKGERITVLEPATVPNSPSGPNRIKIMGMGVAGGIGLAAGFFVLLEILHMTIRRPVEITRALTITPLATIPRFETLADRRQRRLRQVLTMLFILVAVPTALWAVDQYYMPIDVLFDRVVARFG